MPTYNWYYGRAKRYRNHNGAPYALVFRRGYRSGRYYHDDSGGVRATYAERLGLSNGRLFHSLVRAARFGVGAVAIGAPALARNVRHVSRFIRDSQYVLKEMRRLYGASANGAPLSNTLSSIGYSSALTEREYKRFRRVVVAGRGRPGSLNPDPDIRKAENDRQYGAGNWRYP